MEITKIEMILVHLIHKKVINQRIAGAKYDCWRLSSIISDLRRYGIDIETQKKKGESCIYYLKSHSEAKTLALNYRYQRLEQY